MQSKPLMDNNNAHCPTIESCGHQKLPHLGDAHYDHTKLIEYPSSDHDTGNNPTPVSDHLQPDEAYLAKEMTVHRQQALDNYIRAMQTPATKANKNKRFPNPIPKR